MKAVKVTVAIDSWSELNTLPKKFVGHSVFCYRADKRTMIVVAESPAAMEWARTVICQMVNEPDVKELKSGE